MNKFPENLAVQTGSLIKRIVSSEQTHHDRGMLELPFDDGNETYFRNDLDGTFYPMFTEDVWHSQ